LKDNEALVIDDLGLTGIKTKEVAGILKALNLKGQTCLIGTVNLDPVIFKSARNIDGVEVLPTAEFNTWIVLRQKRLVLTKAALEALRHPKPAEAKA
jgi:large subunit ribosomal protein L4